jgi:enoyl-CoA hydratase/carnithine racemase
VKGLTSGFSDEIPLQCDFRFAGPRAKLTQIEVSLGLSASG